MVVSFVSNKKGWYRVALNLRQVNKITAELREKISLYPILPNL